MIKNLIITCVALLVLSLLMMPYFDRSLVSVLFNLLVFSMLVLISLHFYLRKKTGRHAVAILVLISIGTSVHHTWIMASDYFTI